MPRMRRKDNPGTAAALMAWRATHTAWCRSKGSRRDFLKKMRLAEHPIEFDHTES